MGSRYHVVMVPYPAQSHIAPLMQLGRLLHARGAHVTLVHTQWNYRRLVDAKGEAAVRPPPTSGFRVEVIEDGLSQLPRPLPSAAQEAVPRRHQRRSRHRHDLRGQGSEGGRRAGRGVLHRLRLRPHGILTVRRAHQARHGSDQRVDARCLAMPLDWVPGMNHMRLKDPMVAATLEQMNTAIHSKAIVLNTLYELEKDVVDALAGFLPAPVVYTVGPLAAVTTGSIDISIWQEDAQCLAWLDNHRASVVYVNFGSIHVMTAAQMREFALGLANCGFPFLWVKRPDIIIQGEEVVLPVEFQAAVARGAGLVAPWCPQAAVLKHPAVGLFVTHCGWNSLLEAAAAGLPVLGWPMFAEQTTNCRQVCHTWCNGAEIPKDVDHAAVSALVREMMEGDLGKEKKAKAAEWKAAAQAATSEGGCSCRNLQRLVEDVLLPLPRK